MSSVSSTSWPPDDCFLKNIKQMQSLPGASSRAVYSEKSTHIVLRVKWSNVPCLLYVPTWKHLDALVFSGVIEGGERSKQVPFQPFLKCFFLTSKFACVSERCLFCVELPSGSARRDVNLDWWPQQCKSSSWGASSVAQLSLKRNCHMVFMCLFVLFLTWTEKMEKTCLCIWSKNRQSHEESLEAPEQPRPKLTKHKVEQRCQRAAPGLFADSAVLQAPRPRAQTEDTALGQEAEWDAC